MKYTISILLSAGLTGLAQAQFFVDVDQIMTEPMPLVPEALGDYTRPISSTVPDAQAYFDQGMQLMYAFAKPEAVRSFREAWKRDDSCAICYWGEAWAWGSYLNGAIVDLRPNLTRDLH